MVKIIQIRKLGLTYWAVIEVTPHGHAHLNTFMSESGARDYVARTFKHLQGRVA